MNMMSCIDVSSCVVKVYDKTWQRVVACRVEKKSVENLNLTFDKK